MTSQDKMANRRLDYTVPQLRTVEDFPDAVTGMLEGHRPSRMPFFARLTALPRSAAADPSFLGQIHLIYQSAMHATRAAVYYMPHLDSPALRKRKLRILVDDDGLPGGDTHHYQLTRAFRNIGAQCMLEDEEFGDPEELCRYLDGETAYFVGLARRLYSRSLGPWCAVETMSVDWMRALAEALSVHFPQFKHEPYFEECFSHMVEERHAAEALEVTQLILRARPDLLAATLCDAKSIAEALDGVWTQLDRIVQRAAATACPASAHAQRSIWPEPGQHLLPEAAHLGIEASGSGIAPSWNVAPTDPLRVVRYDEGAGVRMGDAAGSRRQA